MSVLMPGKDGITTLRYIMARHPLPVIMSSAITTEDARETLRSFELGAVDIVLKDDIFLGMSGSREITALADKIKAVANTSVTSKQSFVCGNGGVRTIGYHESTKSLLGKKVAIIAIGASTGGPKVLQEIIPCLSKDLPVPIVIAQHMTSAFTGTFASMLNELSQIEVKEARDGEPLRPGAAFIAPGGRHMRIVRRGVDTTVKISEDKEEYV